MPETQWNTINMIIFIINRVFYFIGFVCFSWLYSSRLVNCSTSHDAVCCHDIGISLAVALMFDWLLTLGAVQKDEEYMLSDWSL